MLYAAQIAVLGGKSVALRFGDTFWGSFRYPCVNLALDNGFFGVLSSIFPFFALLEPIFGFFSPKCTFGAKNRFWRQKAVLEPKKRLLAFWAPSLAGCQKAKKALFGLQNRFLAPKTVFGAKSAFWRAKTENGLQKRKKWENGAQNTKETIV